MPVDALTAGDLRALRGRYGVPIYVVAGYAGINHRTVTQILTGEREPTPEQAKRLRDVIIERGKERERVRARRKAERRQR